MEIDGRDGAQPMVVVDFFFSFFFFLLFSSSPSSSVCALGLGLGLGFMMKNDVDDVKWAGIVHDRALDIGNSRTSRRKSVIFLLHIQPSLTHQSQVFQTYRKQ